MTDIVPLQDIDATAVECLLDAAFGSDRHGRTAYRMREGAEMLAGLCFAAVEDGALVGSIQCWPVALTDPVGKAHPMIMVGPVAVHPAVQRSGIGRALMHAMLGQVAPGEQLPLVMIGDPEYYGRFFDFWATRTGGWQVPGPYEQHRLLARVDADVVLPETGMLGPWKPLQRRTG